jgi:hypothetical protein
VRKNDERAAAIGDLEDDDLLALYCSPVNPIFSAIPTIFIPIIFSLS